MTRTFVLRATYFQPGEHLNASRNETYQRLLQDTHPCKVIFISIISDSYRSKASGGDCVFTS